MRKPRTIADLRNDPRIRSLKKEEGNGWWAHLRPGYVIENCGHLSTIHESTIRDVCNVLANEVIFNFEEEPYAREAIYQDEIIVDTLLLLLPTT